MGNVVLDLRMVQGRLHGIARYALELARALPRLAPDLAFVGLTGPEGLPPALGPLTPTLPLLRCRAGFLSPLEQPALLAALAGRRVDLFHATSFSLPALWPGPLVATLHDANHLALPELYGRAQQAYYRLVVGPRAQRAEALVTVSEFSREELARHLRLTPQRLQVIPQGVDARFSPPPASQVEAVRQRLGLPARYLLTVGNPKAFKNLALLARLAPRLPLPLVVLAGEASAEALGFAAGTHALAHVAEEDLPALYGGAQALLFPSRYEGFGLPALEAMACGTPVVAARGSSLTEVVGEAGLLVPPDDEAGWLSAVQQVVRDERLRATLRERGRERAARYTWEACAAQTLAVYRRVLEQKRQAR